jgi:DNA-binding beta-propeller fold protein YncE
MTLNVLERALSTRRAPRPLSDAPPPLRNAPVGAWAREVNIWAGTPGVEGSDDGSAALARFAGPTGLAVSATGEVVVADTVGNRIRWIDTDAAHTVHTIAGTGELGARDGEAGQAQFRWPTGVAMSRNGDVFVADSNNYVVRRLHRTPNGWQVSTYAGSPRQQGVRDGPGSQARFLFPVGLALDSDGTLYVADTGVGTGSVRRIAPDSSHTVHTMPRGTLMQPEAVALGAGGALYVVDAVGQSLCRINTRSAESPVCLGGTNEEEHPYVDGSGAVARLHGQLGLLTFRDGSVVVADTANHRLRLVQPGIDAASTRFMTWAGDGSVGLRGGDGAQAQVTLPSGLAALPDGRVLVSDPYHHVLRVVTP